MIFNTQYDDRKRICASAGSRVKDTFKPVFDEKGNWNLVRSGTIDIYEEIQSHADSVDIHVMLKRFVRGEYDVFDKVKGMYGDFSDMPETYIEAMNMIEAGRRDFDHLPIEVKERFGNSFEKFIAGMNDPDFFEKINPKAEEKESVVKEDA